MTAALLAAFESPSVDGPNGHAPLAHTVNSNANRSAPVTELLLSAGACADLALPGIIWVRGFDWETGCLDVTPISYAQIGLLPQFQRREAEVCANLRRLPAAAGRPVPRFNDVSNGYLAT